MQAQTDSKAAIAIDDHLDNFEDFLKHLSRAANAVLPRVCREYTNTFVLLLR